MSGMVSIDNPDFLVDRARFLMSAELSESQLDEALHAGRLFAVDVDGQEYLPDFFLDKRYDGPQLGAVCKVLSNVPVGSRLQFFLTPKGSLNGQTPLEALVDGKAAAVRRAAQGFVER